MLCKGCNVDKSWLTEELELADRIIQTDRWGICRSSIVGLLLSGCGILRKKEEFCFGRKVLLLQHTRFSPSKFSMESRLCLECIDALQPSPSIPSVVLNQHVEEAAYPISLMDNEFKCSHSELLPIIMSYETSEDGKHMLLFSV